MPSTRPDLDPDVRFSGMRVLIAVAIGCVIGAAVAFFFTVLFDNSLRRSTRVVSACLC